MAGQGVKPRINRLNADTISVFDEFSLKAQDFVSDAGKLGMMMMVDVSTLTQAQRVEFVKDRNTLIYLHNKGKRLPSNLKERGKLK